jgi:predicted RNA binding protein YcfA (HicA-like mRNA interferase family)
MTVGSATAGVDAIRPIIGFMKYRDIIKLIEADGWYLERAAGSHLQYRHPRKPGTVTIPGGGKWAKQVPPGTLNSILKQAGLKAT